MGPCSMPVDCQLSAWSQWSSCPAMCGGQQTRSRTIVVNSSGGGRDCSSQSQVESLSCQTCSPTVMAPNTPRITPAATPDWTQATMPKSTATTGTEATTGRPRRTATTSSAQEQASGGITLPSVADSTTTTTAHLADSSVSTRTDGSKAAVERQENKEQTDAATSVAATDLTVPLAAAGGALVVLILLILLIVCIVRRNNKKNNDTAGAINNGASMREIRSSMGSSVYGDLVLAQPSNDNLQIVVGNYQPSPISTPANSEAARYSQFDLSTQTQTFEAHRARADTSDSQRFY
jgi:hypothetical protein